MSHRGSRELTKSSGAGRAARAAVAEDARENRAQAHVVLDALAAASAQRSLCGARQARGLALARRLQAARNRRKIPPARSRASTIVDLGAAPGGWSQVAAKKIKSARRAGPESSASTCSTSSRSPASISPCMDFLDEDAPEKLKAMLGGEADGGAVRHGGQHHRPQKTDHLRIVASRRTRGGFRGRSSDARRLLLCKVFQGGADRRAAGRAQTRFRHACAMSSRSRAARIPPSSMCWRPVFAARAQIVRSRRTWRTERAGIHLSRQGTLRPRFPWRLGSPCVPTFWRRRRLAAAGRR